jgi:hypothetical protein
MGETMGQEPPGSDIPPPPPPPDPPAPPPVDAAAGRKPFNLRLHLSVAIVALIVAVGIGAALGWMSVPRGSPEIPSADQETVLAEMGEPPLFFVGDGPVTEGGEWVRTELWTYPEAGVRFTFLDGALVDEVTVAVEEYVANGSSPASFNRAQRAGDVERLLGESGVALPPVETVYDGLESYAYESARLLVSYLNGWVFLVQTY